MYVCGRALASNWLWSRYVITTGKSYTHNNIITVHVQHSVHMYVAMTTTTFVTCLLQANTLSGLASNYM